MVKVRYFTISWKTSAHLEFDWIVKIIVWAQENFQESLSVNTKKENCSMVRLIEILNSIRNHRSCIFQTKEGSSSLSSAQFKSLHIWCYGSASGTGKWHIWKVMISAERLEAILREGLAYFSQTMLNHTLHLSQQHGFIVVESECWTHLSAFLTFHQLKTFGASWYTKSPKEDSDCWAARILYQTRMGQFLSQRFSNWVPQFTDCC